jgi:DNA-binding FadR family transcriptional regulator
MQEHALEWLRRAIVAGELRPGERVGQDEVAERIGVSIVPVREALRVLEQEGQLTYIPRRGYFVVDLRVADLEEIYASWRHATAPPRPRPETWPVRSRRTAGSTSRSSTPPTSRTRCG